MLEIKLKKSRESKIPENYRECIHGLLYKILNINDLSFIYDRRGFSLWNFNLIYKKDISYVTLRIITPSPIILKIFENYFKAVNKIELNDLNLYIKDVMNIERCFDSNDLLYVTDTALRKQNKEINNHRYYDADDEKYEDIVISNIMKKMKFFEHLNKYKKIKKESILLPQDIKISEEDFKEFKKSFKFIINRFSIQRRKFPYKKETMYCSKYSFKIKTEDKSLIDFITNIGIGNYNSYGHGFIFKNI